MPIDFSPERWECVKEAYGRFWAGELDRPIVPVWLAGRDPGRPEPAVLQLSQATCADFSISPDAVIDRIDYDLSSCSFLGDAFPYVDFTPFGPGVMAAFVGAHVENSTGNVWFRPARDVPIKDLHFEYDPDNLWLRRVKDIYAAGMKRWGGQVLMGMLDLGGNLDVLSTFLPGEKLLLALYDEPDEVKRLTWEAHELWHRYYREINEILHPASPGYVDWSAIFCEDPSYVLQCDFSYMIGPGMFDEFVKPELDATCRRLSRSIYHLDGVGQLPHLDSLLAMKDLDGIQWVPGTGWPETQCWDEVYRRIRSSGKKLQFFGRFDALDGMLKTLGSGSGLVMGTQWNRFENEAEVRRQLAAHGIEDL